MLELCELADDWKSAWSAAVDRFPTATLFHHADWLMVLEETQGLQLVPMGIFDREVMIGILPVFMKRYGTFKVTASPFIVEDTPYLGPVAPADQFHAVLEALDHWMTQHGVAFVRLLFSPDATDGGEVATGYDRIQKHTHIINLQIGIERLWKNLKDGCRGAIKKAQRSNLDVTSAETFEEVGEYYQLADALYRRQGRCHPNSQQFFQRIWGRFHPSENVSLLLARYKGQVVGGIFLGHWRGSVYYLDGASDLKGKELSAGNLLLWEALRWAAELGYQEFDFVGSDIPRLARFKGSFGGKLHSYICLEKSRGWAVRALRNAYPAWKSWLARMRHMVDA